MFINCPDCSGLVATDLATGLPPGRCPRCDARLLPDGEAQGPEPPAPDGPAPAPATAAGSAAATGAPAPDPGPAPDPTQPPAPAATPDPSPARVAGQAVPAFLYPRSAPRPRRRELAIAAGLAVLLTAQVLVAERARLAMDATWRPVVSRVCGVLGCSLPPWREPAAIATQQRDVRPLPGHPGVLRVSAAIRNDARWPQPWPLLILTLSDADGQALGTRAFEPAEYLDGVPTAPTLGSGEAAMVRMDVVEPSPSAVAFDFRFH